MSNASTPTEAEANAVALFDEAVSQLRNSPFFLEEYACLSVTTTQAADGTTRYSYDFPDNRVRDSMLIHFRKLWMDKEPCHHGRVIKILKRSLPACRPALDYFRQAIRQAADAYSFFPQFIPDPKVSPRDVVGLWLNVQVLHTGSDPTRPYTRRRFDQVQATLGADRFEYLFLEAVHSIALQIMGVQQFVPRFENALRACGIGIPRVACPEPSNVARVTPGFTPNADSLEHRVFRLRRRARFRAIDAVLFVANSPEPVGASAVAEAVDARDLVDRLGLTPLQTSDISALDGAQKMATVGDHESAVFAHGAPRTGVVALHEVQRSIVLFGDAAAVVNDQLVELQRILANGGP